MATVAAVEITVISAADGDLAEIVGFVAARNDDDAQHIGYVDTEADDIAAAFRDLEPGAVFAVARLPGGDLVGVLGAEWDLDIGRTWLYGPWGEASDALYAELRAHIPSGAAEHELYPAAANTAVADFGERHGFSGGGASVIYEITRERLTTVPPSSLPEISPDLHEQFTALHDQAFPGTTYTAAALLDREPPPLVVAEDRLLGYVVLHLTPDSGAGELDYIAVAESARGRGLGTRLVRAAVHQAFADERMKTLVLSTNDDNASAHRMYERVGFVRGRPMRGFRNRTGAARN
ncbi:MAG TPA: GNAT family N-acetyltransferase [Actinopolymorphaceae bacterium]|nr:GNAT family N-acetyltransferase [Actinopolymorphaceae bacterium]